MTKWKVCEKKECHMMVRYITGGEITVAVGTSSRPARAQTVRRTLSDRICRQKCRGYFFSFTQAREAAYRSRFSCRSLCGQKGLGHATAYPGEAVCSMQGLLAHFRPPLAVIFRSYSLVPQQSRTQPLQIARQDRLSKSFATATMFYVVISVW